MDSDLNSHLNLAYYKAVARQAVALVPGRRGTQPSHNGSGTVLRSPRGNTFVLTAAHLFDDGDFDELRLVCDLGTDTADFRADRHKCPDADLALVLVPRSIAATFNDSGAGVTLEQVARFGDQVLPDDHIHVVGFPSQMVTAVPQRRVTVFFTVRYPGYGRTLRHEHDGRLALEYGTIQFEGQAAPTALDPKGMSGGAVWWNDDTNPLGDDEFWSPMQRSRLIGVQVAINSERTALLIEDLSHQRAWLESAVSELDMYANEQ